MRVSATSNSNLGAAIKGEDLAKAHGEWLVVARRKSPGPTSQEKGKRTEDFEKGNRFPKLYLEESGNGVEKVNL